MSEQIPKLRVLSQCISPASKTVGHHRHREPELLLVTSGELRALLNGRELVLREGEGLFINSGAAHGVVANSKEGANFICVSFSTDCIAGADDTRLQARYVDPILKARNLDYVPLRGSGWANDICDIMRSMQSTYSSKMPGYELKLKIMVSEIWLTLYENCVPDLGDKRSVSHAEKARIDILRRFIQENYAEKITLEDIAASAHISRGECCRIFKRLYGTTPFQYLVHYRLTRSVYYLSETDKSISQIAQSVGFCSSSYYTKCFRSEYNCTPLKFRQAQHRLAPEPEQNKSNQRTKCRRRFEGSNPSSAAKSSSSVSMSCFFIMDRIFRTGNTRRQLPRRAFETIRDYPRICAMPTSMTADETYPTCCLPHKRPEPAQEPTERALGQYLIPVPQCPSPGLR